MTEYQVLWLNTTNTMTEYQNAMTEYHEYHECYNQIPNTMTEYQMLWPNTTNTKYYEY